MRITYSPKTAAYVVERGLLEKWTAELEKIAGKSGSEVTASWDISGNPPRHLYKLSLSDGWSGEVSKEFYYDTLSNPREMRWALIRLWGDHLKNQSQRMLDRLLATGEPVEK